MIALFRFYDQKSRTKPLILEIEINISFANPTKNHIPQKKGENGQLAKFIPVVEHQKSSP